jgi:hypothetical protein
MHLVLWRAGARAEANAMLSNPRQKIVLYRSRAAANAARSAQRSGFGVTLLMIGGGLLGATLGLRFKVLALVPVALIGLFGIAVLAGLHGSTFAATAVAWPRRWSAFKSDISSGC